MEADGTMASGVEGSKDDRWEDRTKERKIQGRLNQKESCALSGHVNKHFATSEG
jgi:hypothetical protein